MNIIGIAGPRNSGKDLTFGLIQQNVQNTDRLALADFLKNACSIYFDIPRNWMDDRELKETMMEDPVNITSKELSNIWCSYKCVLPSLSVKASVMWQVMRDVETVEYCSPRKVLQTIGTDFLRKLVPDIHLDVADKFRDKSKLSVITDCRFENEVAWVQRHGGKVIYIARPEAEAAAYESTHISERGILDLRQKCDYMLPNDGTIEELEIFLRTILKDMQLIGG